MKNLMIKLMLLLTIPFMWAACNTDVEHDTPFVEAPVLVSSTPINNASGVKQGTITITLKYDKNVFFATENTAKITLNGSPVLSANVLGSSSVLTIQVKVTKATDYTLLVPEGVVLGPNQTPAPAVSLKFKTVVMDKTLVTPGASAEAQKVFAYLLENFESKTLSCAMAQVSWNTVQADRVHELTGKYPAMNCFDYIHLYASPSNWIDYSDISVIRNWWNAGGLVAAMWHWNVPTSDPSASMEEIELWKGEKACPADWSGFVRLTTDADVPFDVTLLSNAVAGDVIRVKTKAVLTDAQVALKNAGWSDVKVADITAAGNCDFEITADFLATLKEKGLIISGKNYTVAGVYLVHGGKVNYSFYSANNGFNAADATVDGTWENEVFTKDLAKISVYLKQLQAANIPIIWRPLHEASGKWFWWGKDAESFKKIWIAMFNYFKSQGLNNLIWVWTSENGDANWYPGDQYVDIVGRDLYGKNVGESIAEYTLLSEEYGNKMVALSECGFQEKTKVPMVKLSEQWAAGARWLYFMPWYDAEGATQLHADDAWWQDAMSQSYVLTREQLPPMK